MWKLRLFDCTQQSLSESLHAIFSNNLDFAVYVTYRGCYMPAARYALGNDMYIVVYIMRYKVMRDQSIHQH